METSTLSTTLSTASYAVSISRPLVVVAVVMIGIETDTHQQYVIRSVGNTHAPGHFKRQLARTDSRRLIASRISVNRNVHFGLINPPSSTIALRVFTEDSLEQLLQSYVVPLSLGPWPSAPLSALVDIHLA